MTTSGCESCPSMPGQSRCPAVQTANKCPLDAGLVFLRVTANPGPQILFSSAWLSRARCEREAGSAPAFQTPTPGAQCVGTPRHHWSADVPPVPGPTCSMHTAWAASIGGRDDGCDRDLVALQAKSTSTLALRDRLSDPVQRVCSHVLLHSGDTDPCSRQLMGLGRRRSGPLTAHPSG